MGLFIRKPKIVKEICFGAWGHLVHDHGLTVEVLCEDIRCVDKHGVKDGFQVHPVRCADGQNLHRSIGYQ